MQLVDYISALSQQLGLPDLQMQPDGTTSVQIADQFIVTVEQLEDADQCLIYAFIERITPSSSAAIYKQLLHANLFGTETSDATLSLDDQTGRVVVHRKLSLVNFSSEDFVENWLRLVGVASLWNQKLMGYHAEGDTSRASDSERPAIGQWMSV